MSTDTQSTPVPETNDDTAAEKQWNKRAGRTTLLVLYAALFWFSGAGVVAWIDVFKQLGWR